MEKGGRARDEDAPSVASSEENNAAKRRKKICTLPHADVDAGAVEAAQRVLGTAKRQARAQRFLNSIYTAQQLQEGSHNQKHFPGVVKSLPEEKKEEEKEEASSSFSTAPAAAFDADAAEYFNDAVARFACVLLRGARRLAIARIEASGNAPLSSKGNALKIAITPQDAQAAADALLQPLREKTEITK